MATSLPATLPEVIRPYHGRINNEAAESILQLGSDAWARLQRTSTATSTSESGGTATEPSSVSSQSSIEIDADIAKATAAAPCKTQQAFSIQPGHVSHADQICNIGRSVFAATFGFSIPPADLAQYLVDSYSLEAIQADFADPNRHFLVAVKSSKSSDRPEVQEVLGFVEIAYHTTEPCLSNLPQESLVELQRLYISSEHQSLGVGRALIAAAQELARSLAARKQPSEDPEDYDEEEADADDDGEESASRRLRQRKLRKTRTHASKKTDPVINMWLGVWEGNFVAQGVYEKAGFERVGDHEFRMGRCVQIDWIMVKQL
ncbi:uncharacterized protein AB675_10040 [Cyphellophora attinorum]|uniref:N-acetyltransferase domain-containing protein n=1 Tax=Cyphellophora attinorum TaxID=1664694 RepID=A0A0N1NWE7_9EURO|nr:uncharacterized protein AB675_10040 [Phialophora attinorum]KPI36665.1 hypothetical protein AB675_10040 [Phialophora attinorum]